MKRKKTTFSLKVMLKLITVMAAVSVIYIAVMQLKDVDIPVLLPVENVNVNGELAYLDQGQLEQIARQYVNDGYFALDLEVIREQLLKQPWIKSVSLRRTWPASLDVYVEEQIPVAYWNKDAFINEDGDVFSPQEMVFDLNIPKLGGASGLHQRVWQFMNLLYRETALLDFEVVSLNLDERRAWQMEVIHSTGNDASIADLEKVRPIKVRLGRFATEKRLQRFLTVLPALFSQDEVVGTELVTSRIQVIDMRYPNGFAIQMKPNKEKQEQTKATVMQQLKASLQTRGWNV